MTRTRFTELVGCRLPLQQAGMGGVSTPELAMAVADAGGLGMVALPSLDVIAALRAAGPPAVGAIGANFLMPFLDRAAVEAVSDAVRVVEFFYAEPDAGLVDTVHRGGALAFWQVGSADEAAAAVDAGCDVVVAQGTEAGGHVRGATRLHPLLDAVRAAVDVPVVAAGGIGTRTAVLAALDAGADAVRVGTRFLAAPEADVHPDYLARLDGARGGDTVLTTAFSVMWPDAPHRVLASAIAEAEALDDEVAGEIDLGGQRMAIPKFAVPCPGRSTTGHIGAMALYAGESVDAVAGTQSVADIVAELMG